MVVVTGGFVTTMLSLRVSARSPVPSLAAAAVCLTAWYLLAVRRRTVTTDLEHIDRWADRRWSWMAVAVAVAASTTALVFNTFAATGSDASGYLSYTELLLQGQFMHPEPLAAIAKWTDGPTTLAPLGWRAALEAGFQVPTYAIGLPLLMAPWHALAGASGGSLVVPVALGVAVFITAALAHRVAGPTAALIASVWLATSPVALIESMQIMSDVPVTAAWMACWWFVFGRRPLAAGLSAAIAILIRPNLAPLAVLPVLALTVVKPGAGRDFSPAIRSAIPIAIAGALVAYLQWLYFGSPLRSGYGTAAEIYVLSNVAPNARLYTQWLVETHGPWLLIAPFALVLARRELAWTLAFAMLVTFAYLVYAMFESWTYLRFLLPAIAVAMIAVSALVAVLLRRAPVTVRVPAVAAVLLVLASMNIAAAREHSVFRLADRQARGRVIGERLADLLPVNSVIVSSEQSGTMRYYTGRTVVRWDLMVPTAMPDALEWLTLNGYQVWVVLDDWEEETFRKKFPDLAAASIDYEPAVESAAGVGIRTRAWRARRLIAKSSNNE